MSPGPIEKPEELERVARTMTEELHASAGDLEGLRAENLRLQGDLEQAALKFQDLQAQLAAERRRTNDQIADKHRILGEYDAALKKVQAERDEARREAALQKDRAEHQMACCIDNCRRVVVLEAALRETLTVTMACPPHDVSGSAVLERARAALQGEPSAAPPPGAPAPRAQTRAQIIATQRPVYAMHMLGGEPPTAEGPVERYERLAAEFKCETGLMAPGKDMPAAMGDDRYQERRERWDEWLKARAALQDEEERCKLCGLVCGQHAPALWREHQAASPPREPLVGIDLAHGTDETVYTEARGAYVERALSVPSCGRLISEGHKVRCAEPEGHHGLCLSAAEKLRLRAPPAPPRTETPPELEHDHIHWSPLGYEFSALCGARAANFTDNRARVTCPKCAAAPSAPRSEEGT